MHGIFGIEGMGMITLLSMLGLGVYAQISVKGWIVPRFEGETDLSTLMIVRFVSSLYFPGMKAAYYWILLGGLSFMTERRFARMLRDDAFAGRENKVSVMKHFSGSEIRGGRFAFVLTVVLLAAMVIEWVVLRLAD